jgi:hypothetical protein
MVTLGTRGPITEEERDGEASRVEGMLYDVCLNLPHWLLAIHTRQ